MTASTTKKLRELRERQSRERGRMAELALLDELSDEQRSELDVIERGHAGPGAPDSRRHHRRRAGRHPNSGRPASSTRTAEHAGAASSLRSTGAISPTTCWPRPGAGWWTGPKPSYSRGCRCPGNPAGTVGRAGSPEQRAVTADAPGTVGVNLDPIRPSGVRQQHRAAGWAFEMPRVGSGTYATATITTSTDGGGPCQERRRLPATAGAFTVTTATPKRVSARLELSAGGYRRGGSGELREPSSARTWPWRCPTNWTSRPSTATGRRRT